MKQLESRLDSASKPTPPPQVILLKARLGISQTKYAGDSEE